MHACGGRARSQRHTLDVVHDADRHVHMLKELQRLHRRARVLAVDVRNVVRVVGVGDDDQPPRTDLRCIERPLCPRAPVSIAQSVRVTERLGSSWARKADVTRKTGGSRRPSPGDSSML